MPNFIPTVAEYFLDEYDAERFWSRVNFHGGQPYLSDPLARLGADAGECWPYQDGDLAGRYGRFKIHGVEQSAHRIAYRDFGNKLADDQPLDHLCRNTWCCNPGHLEPVTHLENVQRGKRGNITHCPSGHEYTAENTSLRHRGDRAIRCCKTCIKAQKHELYLRRKAEGK